VLRRILDVQPLLMQKLVAYCGRSTTAFGSSTCRSRQQHFPFPAAARLFLTAAHAVFRRSTTQLCVLPLRSVFVLDRRSTFRS
jgi:hypothetical protein